MSMPVPMPIWMPFFTMEGDFVNINLSQIESWREVKYPPVRKDCIGRKTVVTLISGREHDIDMSKVDFEAAMGRNLQMLAEAL